MAGLNDLLSWADNKRRVVGRNLSDLVNDPMNYLDQTGNQAAITAQEYMSDPMNFVGGGLGRTKFMAGGKELTAPTQATLAGRSHSMGMVDDAGASRLYNMGGGAPVDPEMLKMIEDELARRGRVFAR